LAFTGFQAATVSLIGVVLLGGGALLIVFGRRRRAGR
jgi:LPXTG-motif cell wall-anchored protein